MTAIKAALDNLFQTVDQLEKDYAKYGRKFTIDGHLIGSIGEVLAAEAYDLELADSSMPVFDAWTKTEPPKTVQIKATQIDRVSFSSKRKNDTVPDYVIVIKIFHSGDLEPIYNGPGKLIYDNLGKSQKNGQSQISLAKLRRLMVGVTEEKQLPCKET